MCCTLLHGIAVEVRKQWNVLLSLVTCAVFNGARREGAHLTEDKLRVVVETVFLVLQLSFALLCKFKLASFCISLAHRLESGLFGHR